MRLWGRLSVWLRGGASQAPPSSQVGLPPTDAESLCRACLHFRNDAATLAAALPGLASLSSADGAARADDGLCLRHDRFVTPRSSCRSFRARATCAATSGKVP